MKKYVVNAENPIQALLDRVRDYCRDEKGRARDQDVISTLAALTGEAIQGELGLLGNPEDDRLAGELLSDPYIAESLFDDGSRLENLPHASAALGPLRLSLEEGEYPLEKGPDLVPLTRETERNILSSTGFVPLNLPEVDMPQISPLQANRDLREDLGELAERAIEKGAQTRYAVCIDALASALSLSQERLAPRTALYIACATVIAMTMAKPLASRERSVDSTYQERLEAAMRGPRALLN